MSVIPHLCRRYKIGNFNKVISHREAGLYALGVGATSSSKDLQYTYENHPDFKVLPSLSAQFSVLGLEQLQQCPGLPEYDPLLLLHGEQRIELHAPLRPDMNITAKNKVIDVADKKSGALVTIESKIIHEKMLIATNYANLFIRGIGGFGDTGELTPATFPKASKDTPDHSIELQTNENQAHLYRLASGDLNPLHCDHLLAKEKAGFDEPILHGLCTLGFTTRAFCDQYETDYVKEIGTRFTAPYFPGEKLTVNFFEDAEQVVFETNVGEQTVAKGYFVPK